MLGKILTAALVSAAAPASNALPSSEWASRMIMSFTPEGELNGCRLENSGGLAQPAAADADCMAMTGARPHSARFAPEATTNLIFEERFIPGLVEAGAVETPPGDQLLSQQLIHVRIAPDGQVEQCRPQKPTGTMPPLNAEPCDLLKDGFQMPPGRSASAVGTMILSVYVRAEAIA